MYGVVHFLLVFVLKQIKNSEEFDSNFWFISQKRKNTNNKYLILLIILNPY